MINSELAQMAFLSGVLGPVLKMERGCVEDQPQHANRTDLWPAAAGRGRHSRAPLFLKHALRICRAVYRKGHSYPLS
jgi:hypothetical protein